MIHPDRRSSIPARGSAPACSVGAFASSAPTSRSATARAIGPHCSDRRARPGSAATTASTATPRSAASRRTRSTRGERTELVIGDRNMIREFVTINRGTGSGGGVTRIGDDNWLLAYVHIAHDCMVGNHCVFSNNATLAGHVDRRRPRDPERLRRRPPVLPDRRARLHRHGRLVNGDVPPFVMVAQEGYGRAARHQQRRPEAPRLRRRAHRRDQARLPRAVHVRRADWPRPREAGGDRRATATTCARCSSSSSAASAPLLR